jgi:hypothetical protein
MLTCAPEGKDDTFSVAASTDAAKLIENKQITTEIRRSLSMQVTLVSSVVGKAGS